MVYIMYMINSKQLLAKCFSRAQKSPCSVIAQLFYIFTNVNPALMNHGSMCVVVPKLRSHLFPKMVCTLHWKWGFQASHSPCNGLVFTGQF